MARYTESVCRICRREGQKLFLKGDRCYTDKCAVTRRAYAPGQHGQGRKKLSGYGLQLREKQKARRYYGVLEGQFRHYFELANKKAGVTGENLLAILESRLDNVVYRLGFGTSRPEARQLVRHGHFTVNGKRVNIPSYLISANDVIAVCEKSKSNSRINEILDVTSGRSVPEWLSYDADKMQGTVLTYPKREDIDLPVMEHLIVELYSK
jgi:small subunit ribosomal protein S4